MPDTLADRWNALAARQPRWLAWVTVLVAAGVGAVAAWVWGMVGAAFFDGTARSLVILDVLVFIGAALVIGLALVATGTWAIRRLVGHMGIALASFASVFAVFFVVIMAGSGCGLSIDEVSWQDRDLYDALNVAPVAPDGAPVGNGTFAVAQLRSGVAWWTPQGDGTLSARLHPGADESAVARDARRILEVATDLDEGAIDDRVAALLATRNETSDGRFGSVSYGVAQQVTLDPFLPPDGFFRPSVTLDGVTASFSAAVKQASLDGKVLRVDAFGQARMSHPWGEISESDVLDDVRSTLTARDLPAPGRVDTQGSIC